LTACRLRGPFLIYTEGEVMLENNRIVVYLVIRHLLTSLGGMLTAAGVSDVQLAAWLNETASLIAGIVFIIVGVAWSYVNKRGWVHLSAVAHATEPEQPMHLEPPK
jgi:hypothetical protein